MNNLVILQKPAHLRHRTASLVLCIVIINCMLSALTGCNSKKLALSSPISVTDYKLNTYVQIDSYTNVNKNVLSDALGLCDYYEHIFSRTLETSELYKVNTQQTTAISDELYELIELGLYYSQLSYGTFDITIGSVSRLWDFNTDTPDVPDSSAIADALAYVDYTKVSLSTDNDGTHHISIPDGYCLDLGAIAKGYIADKIKAYLIDNGVERAIINLGGNVLCVGEKSSDNPFLIGIKKPFSEDSVPLVTLRLNNKSAVSSGNYERYFYQDGKLYHHILNPSTGYPYDNGLSDVTIISDASVTGDCLSTTCFALGADKGLELIESLSGIEAMFVMSDGTIKYSSGFSSYLK